MATQTSEKPAPAPAKGKEQEEECPWCAYMKKGPCRDVFVVSEPLPGVCAHS